MKVTLKKAAKLRNALSHTLDSVTQSATASLSVYTAPDKVTEAISAEKTRVLAQAERAERLEDALYWLRAEIGRVNHESGINWLLTSQKRLERRIGRLERFVGSGKPESPDVAIGKVSSARALIEKGEYGYRTPSDEVQVSVLSASDMEGFNRQLVEFRREWVQAGDEIEEKNHSHHISLSEEVVQLLKAEGIL